MTTSLFSCSMPSMRRWVPAVLSTLVLAGCGAGAGLSQDQQSGFLGSSYDRLQPVPSNEEGVNIYRYKSPTFNLSDYKGVMIDPVVIYQTATADATDKGITEETIYKVRQEIDTTLARGASERFNVVSKPGPGIGRISIAITGAEAIGDGFRPRNLIPVSAVLNVASKVAGVQNKNAMIVVEAKIQDSVTGVLLGEAVYTVAGESFRLQSSSVEAFQALAVKWVQTALREAVRQKAQPQ